MFCAGDGHGDAYAERVGRAWPSHSRADIGGAEALRHAGRQSRGELATGDRGKVELYLGYRHTVVLVFLLIWLVSVHWCMRWLVKRAFWFVNLTGTQRWLCYDTLRRTELFLYYCVCNGGFYCEICFDISVVRWEGVQSWFLRRGTVRIPALQTCRWTGRATVGIVNVCKYRVLLVAHCPTILIELTLCVSKCSKLV